MDLTQLAVTVKFMEFNFADLFYVMQEHYKEELVEEWFDEGVFLCQPKGIETLPFGRALSIDRWTIHDEEKKRYSTDNEQYVLVQILQMMPLRLNGFDAAKLVLHELVIVAWDCTDDWTPLKPADKRFKLKRRSEEQFVIVLDRWVSYSVLHACRKGHLALLFDRSMYLDMMRYSKELMRQVDEEVNSGMNVQLGRTMQEISSNLDKFHRARALLRRVFDLVDVAYVTVQQETTVQELQGTRLFITDELTAVKPPPMPSPVGED